jgi:hypothetical protein
MHSRCTLPVSGCVSVQLPGLMRMYHAYSQNEYACWYCHIASYRNIAQRATIDPVSREFFVLSGLMREKNSTQETVKNTFWGFSIKRNAWMRVQSGREQGELGEEVLTRVRLRVCVVCLWCCYCW